MNTFDELSLDPSLHEGLSSMGFKTPTPIQQNAIPVILEGKDLIACAQTGTGKTGAYLIPIIQHILQSDQRHLNALIIAPTRELVLQIDQQIDGLGYFCSVSSIAIYGGNDGRAWDAQKHALTHGAEIVCATPGRLIALLQSGQFKFESLKHLVLDEADRMLDMGFIDDIKTIITYLPKDRQTVLLSATMPKKIRELAMEILKDPVEISLSISKPAAGITQQAYVVYDSQKLPMLEAILDKNEFRSVILFSSTKDKVKELERTLRKKYEVKAFHSDLEQAQREEIMREFKSGKLRILIGTDILSRGIDVDGIDLVVNFDVPPDAEDYIHRIGRTARAEKLGTAVTFINPKDMGRFGKIEELLEKEVDKLPVAPELGETPKYSTEPERKGNFRRKPFRKGPIKKN